MGRRTYCRHEPLFRRQDVTKAGSATITFNDGGTVQIQKNSNMQVDESQATSGGKGIKRKITLLLGKMNFKSGLGSNKADTTLQTTTMVCGLRGTEGTLSIGADGQTYITFSEGGASYTIGDFISGEATDVPDEIANLSPAQKAAFVAAAAASQAQAAATQAAQVAAGATAATTEAAKQAQLQADYAAAAAAKAAAEEVVAYTSSLAAIVEEAQAVLTSESATAEEKAAAQTIVTTVTAVQAEATAAVQAATAAEETVVQEATDAGVTVDTTAVTTGTTTPETTETTTAEPVPGFTVDVEEVVNDQEPASPI